MSETVHQAKTIVEGMEEQYLRLATTYGGAVIMSIQNVDLDSAGNRGAKVKATIYLSAAQLRELAAAATALEASAQGESLQEGGHLLYGDMLADPLNPQESAETANP